MEKTVDELADEKLNKLLSVVDTKKIISMDKVHGLIYIGGEKADEARLQSLRAEAEALIVSELWKILYETPKALAEKAMFVKGETIEDLNKGRSMLYTLDTQRNILEKLIQIKNGSPK